MVTKSERILEDLLAGRSDANIRFDDLRRLLVVMGFEERVRGSHHMFTKSGIEELVNLQREGAKAKTYQVKQVRRVIIRYGLARD